MLSGRHLNYEPPHCLYIHMSVCKGSYRSWLYAMRFELVFPEF
jgi:hypothetical protein